MSLCVQVLQEYEEVRAADPTTLSTQVRRKVLTLCNDNIQGIVDTIECVAGECRAVVSCRHKTPRSRDCNVTAAFAGHTNCLIVA